MILIIDNYDSFTYNLCQQIAQLGHAVKVVAHDAVTIKQIENMQPSHIVVSPGPKRPQNSRISLQAIQHFYKTVPLLGVCLGHQCIGEVFGSNTVEAPTILHGKTDVIHHKKRGLLAKLPNPFIAARYNSLVLDRVPPDFHLSAWSTDGSIMAIEHKKYPVYGVQFHPESFMTPQGNIIMRSFLQCTAK